MTHDPSSEAVEIAYKDCSRCGETKPLSQWYNSQTPLTHCAQCHREMSEESRARRRERLGADVVRTENTARMRRLRQDPEFKAKERLKQRAANMALRRLRDLHRPEYEHLIDVCRSELGLPLRRVPITSFEETR